MSSERPLLGPNTPQRLLVFPSPHFYMLFHITAPLLYERGKILAPLCLNPKSSTFQGRGRSASEPCFHAVEAFYITARKYIFRIGSLPAVYTCLYICVYLLKKICISLYLCVYEIGNVDSFFTLNLVISSTKYTPNSTRKTA